MSPETQHVAGDNNDYHDAVNNGDQYFGQVHAGVVGGKGHKNTFDNCSLSGDDLVLTCSY